jgi:PAS domain S-box-containing protein
MDLLTRLRNNHGPSTIRGKMVLWLALLLGGVAAFLLSYVPAQMSRQARAQLAEKAEAIGEVAAYSLVGAVLFDDEEMIEEIIRGVRQDNDIRYVVVEDSSGLVKGDYAFLEASRIGYRATDENDPVEAGTLFKVAESIRLPTSDPESRRSDGATIGTVYLGYSMESVYESVADTRQRLAIVIAGVFLFAYGGILALGSVLTRPIARIARAAEEIAGGDLTRRSNVSSSDEVGRFARVFDSMVGRLQETQLELEALNRGLEQRVSDRTRALNDALRETLQAERETQQSKRHLRTIFDSAAIGIALVDKNLQVMEANPAFKEMFQASRGDLIGRSATELFGADDNPDTVEQLLEVLGGVRDLGEAEVRCEPVAGDDLWVNAVVSPMRDGDGNVICAVAMVQNVTRQKQLAEQLQQSQKLDAVGRLAGGIAHDFNNLLTVINSVSDLMLADLGEAEHLREDIMEIRKAGNRAADLTRQLLAFSRRQSLKPCAVDVNVSIREMSALLRRLIGEDIALDLHLAETLPRVKADPGQLGQVVLNLAVNARDAMPRGGRLLIQTSTVELGPEQAAHFDTNSGSFVQIAVTDTGYGMDADTRAHIFEPFFTTKMQGKGTGLGLPTVYGIVKQSSGGLSVQSEVGRGSTFLIVLPVTHDVELKTEVACAAPSAVGKESVLVVEDEPSVRLLTTRILRDRGYEVIECVAPADALALVRMPKRIDAILSDVIMPGMSGPEMTAEIRKSRPGIPVLFMSGYPREELSDHGMGNEEFLQKPMTPDELATAVRALLDRSAAGTCAA